MAQADRLSNTSNVVPHPAIARYQNDPARPEFADHFKVTDEIRKDIKMRIAHLFFSLDRLLRSGEGNVASVVIATSFLASHDALLYKPTNEAERELWEKFVDEVHEAAKRGLGLVQFSPGMERFDALLRPEVQQPDEYESAADDSDATPTGRLQAPGESVELGFHFFETMSVRTLTKGLDPWFVAKDVCQALGIQNHRKATASLDSDERDCVSICDAIGRDRKTTVISEAGLYKLIARSSKPQAKRFDRWVRHEVLPEIRKTGSFAATPAETETEPADWRSLREARLDRKAGADQVVRIASAIRRGAKPAEVAALVEAAEVVTGRSLQHLLPTA